MTIVSPVFSGEPVLLACDLDGTLLDHEGVPASGVGEALEELVRTGVRFVVVSSKGRLLSILRALILPLL